MTEVVVNPKYRDLIPRLSSDEFSRLEQNVVNEGLREPILLYGNTIVDGHNRHSICVKHGLHIETKQIDFRSDEEAMQWIIKNQLGRRNLNESARAMLAVRLESSYAAASKARRARGLKQNQTAAADVPERDGSESQVKGEARELAANDMGVSPRLVQDAKRVVACGVAELIDAAQSGQISVSAAVTLSLLKPETLRKVLNGDKKSIASLVKKIRQSKRQGQAKAQAASEPSAESSAQPAPAAPGMKTSHGVADPAQAGARVQAVIEREVAACSSDMRMKLGELLRMWADQLSPRPRILPPAPPAPTSALPAAGIADVGTQTAASQ